MLKGIKWGPALTAVLGIASAIAVTAGHLTPVQAAALASTAAAIGTITSALRGGKGIDHAVLTGACSVVLTDLTLFSVHLTPGQMASVVSAVSLAAAGIMHLAGTEPAVNPPG